MNLKRLSVLILIVIVVIISQACETAPVASPAPTPTPTPTSTYSQYQLEYQLLARYPDYFWCDPDFYPIGRPEEPNAQQQFPAIRANLEEFSAILEHLGMAKKSVYTDAEILSIYREHKLLTRAVIITPSGNVYNFTIRTGENQGLSIEGTVAPSGRITVLKQEPSFNTCPICLAEGTLIDTPEGPVPVEKLPTDALVWTRDPLGHRVKAQIIKVSSTPVPLSFMVISVTLEDGRMVTASPGHPTSDLRALGSYRLGDILDGVHVSRLEYLPYNLGRTFDLLPSGGTGLYWANGILLESTLTR